MWLLKGPKGELVYLKRNSTITVGRTQGDVILREDKSVSRNHASVTTQTVNDDKKSFCFVKDLGSKYGSSVIRGDETIKVTEKGVVVQHNDKIKFGLQNNDYIVTCIPIVVLVSSMNNIDNLRSIVNDLDGVIVHEWTNNVTHLTTFRAKLAQKITMALVNCIPVVGIEYWKAVRDAVEHNQEWPKCTQYILPVSEDTIDNTKVSLGPNPDRKTLFHNLTFLFFSFSQLKIYKEIIRAAGGKVLMFDASKHTDLTQFCSDEFVVVFYMIGTNQTEESILDSQRLKTGYVEIEELLRDRKRRMISDTEITLAILACSLKQNCNPKHNYKELLVKQNRNNFDDKKKAPVFALDTQDLQPKPTSLHKNDSVIAESNELTSQDLRRSQDDTQFSNANCSNMASRASSPSGISCISSIHYDSQESTGDIETDLANLNVDQKLSQKRAPEPLTFVPAKKAKSNSGSFLFPVLPKNKSQDKFSPNLQGSQRLQSTQNSQVTPSTRNLPSPQSSQSSNPVLFSQHIRKPTTTIESQNPQPSNPVLFSQHIRKQTTQSQNKFLQPSISNVSGKETTSKPTRNIFGSWMDEPREKGKERNRDSSGQSDEKNKRDKQKEDELVLVESGSEMKRKRMRAENQLDSGANNRGSPSDDSVVCIEPEAKKKRLEVGKNSNSERFKILAERNDKRKRDSGAGDSDSDNIIMQKKQNRIVSFTTDQTELSVQSDDFENPDCVTVGGLIREKFHDSLLERTFGQKTFYKVYDAIPIKRVTRDSMILCGIENDENLE